MTGYGLLLAVPGATLTDCCNGQRGPEPLTADLVFTGLRMQNPFLYVSPKWTDLGHRLPRDWEFATHRVQKQRAGGES
jgi:hypothetical protein